MSSLRRPLIGATFLRIVIFANFVAMMAYGAVTPSQMSKVTAEVVTIAITGFAMAVQVYVTLSVYVKCLPYKIWAVVTLDAICAAGWIAAIGVLSYCDRAVVYMPREGDPDAWFECAGAASSEQVLTDQGFGSWINVVWCEVEVDGRDRLMGNGAARQQVHVLIGLSAASLFLTGCLLLYTIKRGIHLGVIKSRRGT